MIVKEVQQVRQAWCDGNREINESRGTLIGSELISNRDCDTINLLPLSAELHLSLSSFHAPLPLQLFSLTYASCLSSSPIVILHLILLESLCLFTVTFHVSLTFSLNYVFSFLITYTHNQIYKVYSKI